VPTRLAGRLSLALFVVTLVVFLPVVSHGFCSYDAALRSEQAQLTPRQR
jgi:hypothetical protein